MSSKEIKAIYLALKESGDLFNLFPDMTGRWEEDGKRFTKEYDKNEKTLTESIGAIGEPLDEFEEDFDTF